jgi:putative FmdB family regulatory protein
MPIYEYVCTTCGKEFEVMQKFSAKPLKKCTCSSEGPLVRKLSVPAFHLQGGGWYAEGYSNKKNGNGKGEAKADGKTDGKTAGKSAGSEPSAAAKAEPSATKSDKAEKKPEKAAKKNAAPAPA